MNLEKPTNQNDKVTVQTDQQKSKYFDFKDTRREIIQGFGRFPFSGWFYGKEIPDMQTRINVASEMPLTNIKIRHLLPLLRFVLVWGANQIVENMHTQLPMTAFDQCGEQSADAGERALQKFPLKSLVAVAVERLVERHQLRQDQRPQRRIGPLKYEGPHLAQPLIRERQLQLHANHF